MLTSEEDVTHFKVALISLLTRHLLSDLAALVQDHASQLVFLRLPRLKPFSGEVIYNIVGLGHHTWLGIDGKRLWAFQKGRWSRSVKIATPHINPISLQAFDNWAMCLDFSLNIRILALNRETGELKKKARWPRK
jgi:hypothetical protein